MALLPEHNLAHKPGPDVPDDMPPPHIDDLTQKELAERLEDAVFWMRTAAAWLHDNPSQHALMIDALEYHELEGMDELEN